MNTDASLGYSSVMLAFDRTAARAAWTVFLLAWLICTAYAIRETLLVFAAALFFAYMLMPIVAFVERYTPRAIGSTVALSVVYLAFLGLLIALMMTIGARIADEASSLAQRLPDLIQNREWVRQIPLPSWLEPVRDRIVQEQHQDPVSEEISRASSSGVSASPSNDSPTSSRATSSSS